MNDRPSKTNGKRVLVVVALLMLDRPYPEWPEEKSHFTIETRSGHTQIQGGKKDEGVSV